MFKKLLIEIGEDNDYVGIRCAYCKKVFVSDFIGMYGTIDGLNILEDEYYKMLKHNCSKMKNKKKK